MKLKCLALAALAVFASQAQAEDGKDNNTGSALLKWCSAVERFGEGNKRGGWEEDADFYHCIAYIDGVEDMWQWSLLAQGKSMPVCIPEGVTRGQAARIVVAYLRRNPEMLHLNGSLLVVGAYADAYPCAKPENKTRERL